MLKKFVVGFALICSAPAFGAQYTFLGGALNLQHCLKMAGDAGFGRGTFGGYVNGIYYWNACLGSEPRNGGGTEPRRQVSFKDAAYSAWRGAFDVNWYIVDHDPSVGARVYQHLNDVADRLLRQTEEINERAKYGLNRYDLRDQIAEAQSTYFELRGRFNEVSYLVAPRDMAYWRSLEKSMRVLSEGSN
jgi:hypothetical protein